MLIFHMPKIHVAHAVYLVAGSCRSHIVTVEVMGGVLKLRYLVQ